jgi:hypothetical protein
VRIKDDPRHRIDEVRCERQHCAAGSGNRRFYRHVSFETMLGLAANRAPASYRDIVGRVSPRKIRSAAKPCHYI